MILKGLYLVLIGIVFVVNTSRAQFPLVQSTNKAEFSTSFVEYGNGYFLSVNNEDTDNLTYLNRASLVYKMDYQGVITDSILFDSTAIVKLIVVDSNLIVCSNKLDSINSSFTYHYTSTSLYKLDTNLAVINTYNEPVSIWLNSAIRDIGGRFLMAERYIDAGSQFREVISQYDNDLNLIKRDSLALTIATHHLFRHKDKLVFGGAGSLPNPSSPFEYLQLAVIDSATMSIDSIFSASISPCVNDVKVFMPLSDSTFISIDDSLSLSDFQSCQIRLNTLSYNGSDLDTLNSFLVGNIGESNALAVIEVVAVNSLGNLIIGGSSYSVSAGQWAWNTDGGYSVWSVTPSGVELWRSDFGTGENRFMTSIYVDSNDDIIVVGTFKDPAHPSDLYNLHLTKINSDGTTELSENNNRVDILGVYPNPSKSGVFHLSKPIENVSVFDINGRLIKSVKRVDSILDLSNLSEGIYCLKGTDLKNNMVVTRLLKN
jgi:hypothetical protein